MKIRDHISLTLSLTALLAVAALGVLVYMSTAQFHEREFFSRLEERVALTELIFLEKNTEVTEAVRERFLQRLDEEKEYAITLRRSGKDSLNRFFPKEFSQSILKDETATFWQGERQGAGRRYHLPTGEYVVVVTAVDAFGRTKLNFLRRILLFGGLGCVILLVAVGRLTVRRALMPLEDKIHDASQISGERLGLRLEVKNPDDEIGEMSTAFNRMLDRLQAAFEAQRHFVSNASHEMRNPLTAIIGEAEVLLARERSPEEYREALGTIQAEAERMERLTRQLLELAKAEALSSVPDAEDFWLDQLLLEVLEKFPPDRLQLDFSLTEDTAGNAFENARPFCGNPHLLRIALSNLVDNALKYSTDKPVTIAFSHTKNAHLLTITDRGIGIPAEDVGRIYQPLFRSRNARSWHGHGIGLPLAKKIIELHGGELAVESVVGEGTVVRVVF